MKKKIGGFLKAIVFCALTLGMVAGVSRQGEHRKDEAVS